jgi:Thioredoxin
MLGSKYIDTGKVRFVFREFPIDIKAAAASMLARCMANDDAGKFFGAIDTLFTQQDRLMADTKDTLKLIGKQGGLSEQAVETKGSDAARQALRRPEIRLRGAKGRCDADLLHQWRETQRRYVVRGTGREDKIAFEEPVTRIADWLPQSTGGACGDHRSALAWRT